MGQASRVNVQLELLLGHRDRDGRRRRAARRDLHQALGGSSPAASSSTAAQRPQLHSARAAADGRRAADGGVATAGGSLRQGQAYAVNGMRPEQNMYLVDGAQNLNRMDGGYALKLPVEAIAEFRILTQSAPPEYGGTGGATTSVVTRSGSNQFHGNLYEFLRNDVFDARNFFSEEVEPLEQNQFGGTTGGPITQGPVLFFGYYEGLRNKQGTDDHARRCRRAQERQGDFSGARSRRCSISRPAACRFPATGFRQAAINPVARNVRGPVPARQRLAVHLPRDARRRATISIRPAAASTSTSRRTISSSRATRYSGGHNVNPDVGARHRRAGLSDARRSGDPRGDRVEHSHLLAVADELAARDVPASRVLLRSAAQPDAAERARVRLRLVQRRRARARRSSTSAATRRSAARSPVRATRRRTRSRSRTAWPGRSGAHLVKVGGEFRHTGDRHVPGDRARTPSSCSPARSRPTTPSPICCSARRSRSTRGSATSAASVQRVGRSAHTRRTSGG